MAGADLQKRHLIARKLSPLPGFKPSLLETAPPGRRPSSPRPAVPGLPAFEFIRGQLPQMVAVDRSRQCRSRAAAAC